MSQFVGYRVARWRELAGLTQAQLGERVGRAQSLISMIENGTRPVVKRSLLIELADALGVSVPMLLDQPREPSSAEDLVITGAVGAIRRALDGELEPAELPDPVSVANEIIAARARCDVAAMARLVPEVLGHAHPYVMAERPASLPSLDASVKASVYACYAVKTAGYVDLATRLAEHARLAADRSGEPVHRGASTMAMCQALMADGSRKRALALAERGAAELADATGDAIGWRVDLHLQAALCSASVGRYDNAEAHLTEAAGVAPSAPIDVWHRDDAATNVDIWRVTVSLENGHAGERAPDLAQRVNRSKIRTPQRFARLYMDSGRGFYARNDNESAVRMFHAAYDTAPSEVRNRGTVREIAGQLVRDAGASGGSEALRDLAIKLGIDPVASAA